MTEVMVKDDVMVLVREGVVVHYIPDYPNALGECEMTPEDLLEMGPTDLEDLVLSLANDYELSGEEAREYAEFLDGMYLGDFVTLLEW